jgi:hypothetical protein
MMSEFDILLAKFTEKGNAQVHGALCKCVDKNGKFTFYGRHLPIAESKEN